MKQGEGLRRRYLVDQVQIDIQNRWCSGRFAGDDVVIPDLFKERQATHLHTC